MAQGILDFEIERLAWEQAEHRPGSRWPGCSATRFAGMEEKEALNKVDRIQVYSYHADEIIIHLGENSSYDCNRLAIRMDAGSARKIAGFIVKAADEAERLRAMKAARLAREAERLAAKKAAKKASRAT